MGLLKFLKDMFAPKALPAEREYPEKMWREEISKPGAVLKVHRLHLTREQAEGLRVKRKVYIPGPSGKDLWRP